MVYRIDPEADKMWLLMYIPANLFLLHFYVPKLTYRFPFHPNEILEDVGHCYSDFRTVHFLLILARSLKMHPPTKHWRCGACCGVDNIVHVPIASSLRLLLPVFYVCRVL